MDVRFKFSGFNAEGIEEIHIWSINKPSLQSLTVEDLIQTCRELFLHPSESRLALTWFDGEDLVNVNSNKELHQIVEEHLSSLSATPYSTVKPLRIGIVVKKTPSTVRELSELKIDSEKDKQMRVRHDGIMCDECDRGVFGIRYKCLFCPDFDLCESCFCETKHYQHAFCAIRGGTCDAELVKKNLYTMQNHCLSQCPPGTDNLKPLGIQTPYLVAHEAFTSCNLIGCNHVACIQTPLVVEGASQSPTDKSRRESAEWEVLSNGSDSVVDAVGSAGTPATEELLAVEREIEKFPIVPASSSASVKHDISEVCTSAVHSVRKSCTSSQTSVHYQPGASRQQTLVSQGMTAGADDVSESEGQNPQQPVRNWDINSAIREAFRNPTEYLFDAWRTLGIPQTYHSTSYDELQVLLREGYSNEGGILTFLLSENNNNAAVVLDILRKQNI